MKAVLVIDMPEACHECPLFEKELYRGCRIGSREHWEEKPDWCPLRPLPDEKEQWNRWELDFRDESSYRAGWNDFRKEIYEGS